MKTALIVDDSRLARHVLKRQLAEHGIAADTAQSAEAALDYLKDHRPDVVFLDHLMPGMGGFEALEAIKANPLTATIPVMMYTSQAGELYVGQARALGALGVLPKSLQPADVSKVLKSLRLVPGDPSAAAPEAPPAGKTVAPLDERRLQELLEQLFYEHGNTLRAELSRELKQQLAAAVPPAPAEPPSPPRARRAALRALGIATALLGITAAVLGYLLFSTTQLLDQSNQRSKRLVAEMASVDAANARAFAALRTPTTRRDRPEPVEWSLPNGGRFAFGEVPLDDSRADDFNALFQQLEQAGFAGTVQIDVHVGRFCMNYGSGGTLELAPPDQPASSCEQVGWPEIDAAALGNRQSATFANTVAIAEVNNPHLRVNVVSHGSGEPAVGYPPPRYDVTAGDWNKVAASNQRVAVQLLADAATSKP
jgi:CheY-like chemotaxis protein